MATQPTLAMSSSDIELMLIHAVRCNEVASIAVDKLAPELFNLEGEAGYRLIWMTAQEFYKVHKKCIPPLVLGSQLSTRFQLHPELSYLVDFVLNLIAWMYNTPEDNFVPVLGLQYLQKFLNERVFQPSLHIAGSNAAEVIDEINRVYSTTRISTAVDTNVFDLTDPRINEMIKPATPSGSAVFDHLLDGGVRASHLTGVLAPFGGGKTSFSIEVAVNLAKQKKHVLMCQYEQNVMLDIRPRIWSCATGTPTKVFAESTFNNLSQPIKDKITQFSYVGDYLHIEDFHLGLVGGGGISEIETTVLKYVARNQTPSLIVIDWLGVVVRKYLMAQNLPFERFMHATYNEMISRLRELANRFKCEVIVLHQLNADAGKKGPTARPSMYDAAEFRGFAALMDCCVIIGKASPKGIAIMYTDKNRGARGDSFVKIHGDKCRFELLNSDYMFVSNDATGEAEFQEIGSGHGIVGVT